MKRNKIIILIIFFTANFIFTQEDYKIIKKIKENKKLIVSVLNEDDYPFYSTKNNLKNGYDLLLCRNISRALNVDLEIDNSSRTFNDLIQNLLTGKSHIAVSKIKRALDDSLCLSYSDSYLKVGYVLLINRIKIAKYKKYGDYKDILLYEKSVISTLDNNIYKDYLKKYFPENPARFFNDKNDLINELVNGESIAVFLDEIEAKLIFRNNKELAIKILSYKYKDLYDDLHIITSWKNKFLIDYLNIFLRSKYQMISIDDLIYFSN